MPHKLSLLVPGLCGPLPRLEGLESTAMPLVELLKQCNKHRTSAPGYSAQLSELFGVEVGQVFPYAALSLLAHDIEPGAFCWLHADPVNLQADMDRAVLTDSQTLAIEQKEAEQLVNELNAHFAADGVSLLMADRNNWYIRLDPCDLVTTPLNQAVGRNINHLLPAGEAASRWKRLLNEAQMLLHISEVNQQRELRGLAPLNSLWLWGEGVLPEPASSDITQVYADDAVTTGLAKLNHISHATLIDPVGLANTMHGDGHSLVVLNQLDGPCNYGDTMAWLDDMLELVRDWLEPLLVTATSLDTDVNIYQCNGVRYHFRNNNKPGISKLMFWKKDHLRDYVDTQ